MTARWNGRRWKLLPILRRPRARETPSLSQHHQKYFPLCALRRKGQQRVPLCQDGGGFKPAAFRALSEDSVLYRFPQQPLSQKPAEREPSSLAVRHNVYYDMLMHLELSPKHKADLLARGLSEERIEQNMYRTLPMSSSARRFSRASFPTFTIWRRPGLLC